ncbi:MarR family transcriptional regulator [Alkaliphilus pronyensis]|uniref:MarR family transcriptional regulator n=2 Tax=Alkaliphilus pronyensis TaxID=1482732 RepID=A0A6I0FBZ1_9FIRM|nr:MarR family transcriptional regulator [Alkaliphilus pronyensis]
MEKHIFGSIFVLANKLQVVLDRELAKFDMTTKQWLMTAVIEEFFDSPPTLKEVSRVMGSSHQNVKQIALKLEKKGYLALEKDNNDKRVIRLRLTEKSYSFWSQREPDSDLFLRELFRDIKDEELVRMYRGIYKLSSKIEETE